jgi:CBS-domain-containing membrane protein
LFQKNLVGALVVDGEHDGADHEHVAPPDHVLGVVTVSDLAKPELWSEDEVTVGKAMRTDVPRVHARDDAAATLDALVNGDAPAVIVLDEGEHVIGLVTQADLERAMALLTAAGRSVRR